MHYTKIFASGGLIWTTIHVWYKKFRLRRPSFIFTLNFSQFCYVQTKDMASKQLKDMLHTRNLSCISCIWDKICMYILYFEEKNPVFILYFGNHSITGLPSRISACPSSFWANSIFPSLVHVSDLILHIMVVWNGLHDLAILSLMLCLINYA